MKDFTPFDDGVEGDCDSKDAYEVGREGRGEWIGGSNDLGGDLGDCTVTLGGDLVGDLGGEKATMDVGLGFGLAHDMRILLARGVTVPAPLRLATLGEVRPISSLGMSSDMRPSVLLLSSGARRSAAAGERFCGVAGADDLFTLSMFSNWARSEDTGFCTLYQQVST